MECRLRLSCASSAAVPPPTSRPTRISSRLSTPTTRITMTVSSRTGTPSPMRSRPAPPRSRTRSSWTRLTDAGLMTRLKDLQMHVARYTLNAAGNRYGPRFCYGHREVTGIVSFTPPGPRNGFTETTVDVPLHHARCAGLGQVGAGAGGISGAGPVPRQRRRPDKMTLASAGAGWHVPE